MRLNRHAILAGGLFFLAGILISVALAALLAGLVDISVNAGAFNALQGDEQRSAAFERGFGSIRITLNRAAVANWGPDQATGPPNTNQMGDIPTAWASLTPDSQREWLELDYATPVLATALRVFETFNPGAIDRVDLFGVDGHLLSSWTGADPAKPNPSGIWAAEIPVSVDALVAHVRLEIDSPKISGWNEIDAVGLFDSSGKPHWATEARASSSYASQFSSNATASFSELDRLVPGWSTGRDWGGMSRQPAQTAYHHVVEARGWPMLALFAEVSPSASRGRFIHFPYRPIWMGLIVDGAIFGLLLAMTRAIAFRFRRFIRQSRWLRRGCCMICGYDLQFDLLRGCPECGWRRVGQPTNPS